MNELPKDIIIYLALNMDILDVLSICKASKKFNQNICNNKNYWISKLKKDFDIQWNQIYGDPKKLYFDYKKYFMLPHMGMIFIEAVKDKNLNIMKVAILEGVSLPYYRITRNYNEYLLKILPSIKNHLTEEQKINLIQYAVEHGGVNIVKYIVENMQIEVTSDMIQDAEYMFSLLEEHRSPLEEIREQKEVVTYLVFVFQLFNVF
jgi:hypothetical protein